MKQYISIHTGICALLLLTAPLMAGETETATEKIDIQDAERLAVVCDFGAGDLIITTADIPEAAILEVTYDPRRFDYDIEFYTRGEVGHLIMESSTRKSSRLRNADNEWRLTLSTRYPLELELDIGACDAEIDLGGLPLTRLSLDVGAASGEIDFSKPNPRRLKEIKMDIGASSVEVTNLGNANFEFLSFSGGAASTSLDFLGAIKSSCEASLDIGLGSAKFILPEGLAVRIRTDGDGWFSNVDFHNRDIEEVRDDVYETPDFDDADIRLTIDLDIGMGSADFYWE